MSNIANGMIYALPVLPLEIRHGLIVSPFLFPQLMCAGHCDDRKCFSLRNHVASHLSLVYNYQEIYFQTEWLGVHRPSKPTCTWIFLHCQPFCFWYYSLLNKFSNVFRFCAWPGINSWEPIAH
jgi:hypothetical protein